MIFQQAPDGRQNSPRTFGSNFLKLITSEIRNIIFDLGGVILNLSIESSLQQLSRMSGVSLEQIRQAYGDQPEFLQYERGEITDPEFRLALKRIFAFEVPDASIDECWNAMLLDIPAERIILLQELRSRYRTFLLSNTNSIHVKCFGASLQKIHGLSLESLFERVYYSHEMKMRKPDPAIYLRVMKENSLIPDQTLFLDDNKKNVEGAAATGIRTFLVEHPDQILALRNGA